MDLLNFTGFKSKAASEPDIRIGTPEEPIYLAKPVKTGRDARRSENDRITRALKAGIDNIDPDTLLPAMNRQQRRAIQRAKETDRRKNVARYKRRAMKAEREGRVDA